MKEIKVGLVMTIGAIVAVPNAQAQEASVVSTEEPTTISQPDAKQSSLSTPIVTIKPTVESLSVEPLLSPVSSASPVEASTEATSLTNSTEIIAIPTIEAKSVAPKTMIAQPSDPLMISVQPQYSTPQTIAKRTIEPEEVVAEAPIENSTGLIHIIIPKTLSPIPLSGVDKLVVFGDSLSDSGNPSHRTSSAPYFQGRTSNGLLWTENLVASLTNQDTLSKFAVGGTQSRDVQQQIQQYLESSPDTKSSNIHTIWTGTNDYRLGGTNPEWTVNNIQTSIKSLTSAGAKKLLIANIMDLGNVSIIFPTTSASTLSQLSQEHNQRLHRQLSDLANQRVDLYIVPLDFHALFGEMFKDPTRFGFKNDAQSCFITCSNPNDYIILDSIHPTEAANRILSDYTLSILNAPQTIAPQVDLSMAIGKQSNQRIDHQLDLQSKEINSKNNSQFKVFTSGEFSFGEQSSINERSGNVGFNTTAMTIGITKNLSPNSSLGIAFNHSNSSINLAENSGKTLVDSHSFSLYSRQEFDRFFVNGVADYGWNKFDISRALKVTGFDSATANPTGHQFSAQIKAGYNLGNSESSGLQITPTIGVAYQRSSIQGYSESNGSILNLNVKEQGSTSTTLSIGSHFSYNIHAGKSKITPYFNVNYEHSLTDGNREIITELSTQSGIPIRSQTGKVDPDLVRLGLGVRTQMQGAVSLMLGYEATLGRSASNSHSFQGQFQYAF